MECMLIFFSIKFIKYTNDNFDDAKPPPPPKKNHNESDYRIITIYQIILK